jgi:hypothetical protein
MAITAAVACPRICRAAQPGSWQRLERDRPARPQPAPQDRGKPPKIYHRRLVEDRRAQATVERRRRGLRALGLIRDGRRFGTPRSGAPPKPERAAVPERPELVVGDAAYWSNEHIDRPPRARDHPLKRLDLLGLRLQRARLCWSPHWTGAG